MTEGLIFTYLMGTFIALIGTTLSRTRIGFRTRCIIAATFVLWLPISAFGVLLALAYAFWNNSTVTEGLDIIFEKSIFKIVINML